MDQIPAWSRLSALDYRRRVATMVTELTEEGRKLRRAGQGQDLLLGTALRRSRTRDQHGLKRRTRATSLSRYPCPRMRVARLHE